MTIESGEFTEDRDVLELIRSEDYGGEAVVIYRGEGLCIPHFNRKRGWPKDFPDAPLPKAIRDAVLDRYEEMLDADDEGDDDPDSPPRSRPVRRRRRRRG